MLTSHQLPTLDRHEKIVVNTIHKIKSDLLSQTGHIKNKAHQKGTLQVSETGHTKQGPPKGHTLQVFETGHTKPGPQAHSSFLSKNTNKLNKNTFNKVPAFGGHVRLLKLHQFSAIDRYVSLFKLFFLYSFSTQYQRYLYQDF